MTRINPCLGNQAAPAASAETQAKTVTVETGERMSACALAY